MSSSYRYDFMTTTSFVVASMIGTGVFTSLGFQLLGTPSAGAIIILWALGGLASMCGALSYSALAIMLPRSGGEYNFLSRVYGETAGFIAGVLTIVIGFAAPIALAAMALESYANHILSLPWGMYAAGTLLIVALIQSWNVKFGGQFQLLTTIIKLGLILTFIVIGFWSAPHSEITFAPGTNDFDLMLGASYAVSFIYVTYSYTGWSAPVYMMEEIKNPLSTVPKAIITGTFLVTILYVLLNMVFMLAAPLGELSGEIEVGHISGKYIFGRSGVLVSSAIIAFGLISTIGAMLISSSRVAKVMAEDHQRLSFLQKTNSRNAPVAAIVLVTIVALAFILSSSFETVLTYAGFILSFFGLFTVAALFILRYGRSKMKVPFGQWFFPVVPLVYMLIKIWVVVYLILERPIICLYGGLTIFGAWLVYVLVKK